MRSLTLNVLHLFNSLTRFLNPDVDKMKRLRDPHPRHVPDAFHYCRFPEMPATIGTLP